MIRNENDILAEALASMVPYFDRILVLDGTDEGSEQDLCHRILGQFPEVVSIFTDDDVPTGSPVRDGARQLLLDEARRRYGVDNWIGVLHGDEIHVRDPRPVLATINPLVSPCVRVRTAHFFLHPDDPTETLPGAPFGARQQHYMFPGVPETRYFFDTGQRDYDWNLHSKVVPRSFRTGPLIDGLVVAHLNLRSPAQAGKRAADRIESGWQGAHYEPVARDDRVVVRSLHVDGYPDFDHEHLDPVHGRPRPVSTVEAPIEPRLDLQPLLIGGTGRCGSTMLRSLLGTHPHLQAFPFELKMLSWPGGLVDLAERPNLRRSLRLRARLLDQRSVIPHEYASAVTTDWGFRANTARQAFAGYDDAARLVCRVLGSSRTTRAQRFTAAREFVGLLVAHLVGASEVQGWVEQTPANAELGPGLFELFPQATLVNIVRHPCEVAASLLSMNWEPQTLDEAIDHIENTHRRWEDVQAHPGAHTLRLEDLLADPQTILVRSGPAVDQK